LKIGQREDSHCTGGIENIFYLQPHHLRRWSKQGIENRCTKCGLELSSIGQLVYTRTPHKPNTKTKPYCIQCAIHFIEPDDIWAYKNQIKNELERLKSEGVILAVTI